MTSLLDPRNDYIFKRIFGSESNKDVLLAFLNRTFMEAGETLLTEIVLMNPYTDKDTPRDKQSILDILAKTTDGQLINVEMQLFNKYDIEKRTLYYWGKQYLSQLQEGQTYGLLKKCVTINILNYSFLPNDRYHNVFHLREDHTQIPLIDDIEIHFMELPKLSNHPIPVEGGLVNWMLFLKGADRSNWEALTMNEPMLKKAMDTLEFLSQDNEARRLYDARQKYLHDEASMIEGARLEGRTEGRSEGRTEGEGIGKYNAKLEVAQNLLNKGMDVAFVMDITGLSKEEIGKISRTH